jgi:hypothetical protein
MSVEFPQPGTSSLVERVKNILLKPHEEWGRIDAEPATVADIFKSYVVPLAAIGPVCVFIGQMVFGYSAFGVTFRPSLGFALSGAITAYAGALIGVFVMMQIFNALAPNFGGQKNDVQAMKVAAYSCTAAWVAGVLSILPALAMIGALLGLYSLYLLWIGAPRLMRVPEDKAATYTIAAIVVTIVVFIVVGMIVGAIQGMFAPRIPLPGGTLTVG